MFDIGLPPESLLPEFLFWSRDSGQKTLNPYSRNPYHLVLSDTMLRNLHYKSYCPDFDSDSFMVDFEKAEHSAIRSHFIDAIIKGCLFYWKQCLNRKFSAVVGYVDNELYTLIPRISIIFSYDLIV